MVKTSHSWDPDRYLTYADERGRPFVDLLARVGAADPAAVADLGCGPGNLTALLAARWPRAQVTGVDSSAEMIASAQGTVAGVAFEVGDLRAWEGSADVVVSNATLQWLPDHLDLLPGLVDAVAPGGWLAFQVPANFEEPSHTIRRELAAEAPYDVHTAGVAVPDSHEPQTYLDALSALERVAEVDVWETTYLHLLTGQDPVFTWVSGTGARPTLQALPDDVRPAFEREFRARLAAAYPVRDDGTVVLPFRRIFAVARLHEAGR